MKTRSRMTLVILMTCLIIFISYQYSLASECPPSDLLPSGFCIWGSGALERQQQEQARAARERAERESIERERALQERAEKERRDALARGAAERERIERDRAARERADAEKRAAARRDADIAEENARKAAAERDRQRAELEQQQLLVAKQKAQAETAAAERARVAAESPFGISALHPNSSSALSVGYVFVAVITWFASYIRKLTTPQGSYWQGFLGNVSVETLAATLSGIVLYSFGMATEIVWLSIPVLGGLFSIVLLTSFKVAAV